MSTQELVAKLWNLCNLLRDDGVTYHEYINELTFLIFLKMAKETDLLAPSVKEKALRVGADMQGNFIKSYNAGVKIAFGTDSGVSLHGENMQEAILMSEAGMPNMAVLKSATIHGADLIDMSAQLGTLEKGKYADIIAMPASPIENIKALLDVDFVMKGGKVYKD